jgi:hypothetical protein
LAKLSKYKQFLIEHGFPENLPDYDVESYWDARYELEQQEIYDWYVQPQLLKDLFMEFVDSNGRVLELGSGKSAMVDSLNRWGYKELIGSDFSWTLINQKKSEERYLKRGVRWERVDITKEWPDWGVNCVFEKATLDCLPLHELKRTIDFIQRNLKERGIFFHISCCPPEARINILKRWDVKVYEFPKTIIPIFGDIDDSKSYYAYVCTK